MGDVSAIYKISINDKDFYIGSTKQYHLRWLGHKSELKLGIHYSKKLQSEYNQNKLKNIKVTILEEINQPNFLLIAENYWIQKLKPTLNKSQYATNLGLKHTQKTKNKISQSKKANPTKYWLGKQFSEEHRAKLSAWQVGKKMTDKTKQAIKKSVIKKTAKLDMDGNIIKIYDSASDAARDNSIAPCSVILCCTGKRTKTSGHYYKYI